MSSMEVAGDCPLVAEDLLNRSDACEALVVDEHECIYPEFLNKTTGANFGSGLTISVLMFIGGGNMRADEAQVIASLCD